MAVVILGGLVTTTFLSLFVLPGLYLRFAGGRPPSVSPEEKLMHRWAGAEPEPAAATGGADGIRGARARAASKPCRAPAWKARGVNQVNGSRRRRRSSRPQSRLLAAALVVLIACLALSACKEVESEDAAGYEP